MQLHVLQCTIILQFNLQKFKGQFVNNFLHFRPRKLQLAVEYTLLLRPPPLTVSCMDLCMYRRRIGEWG